MELDLLGAHADRAYPVLASLITPRPIAWISTSDSNGIVNLAPFSFFNVFGSEPPLVAVAPGDRPDGNPKDTARNMRETGEFVVNLVSEALAPAMVRTAASLAPGVDEAAREGLAMAPSITVAPPRVALAPAALECKVHSIQEIGSNRLVLGIVHRVHVLDEIIDPTTLRIHQHLHTPVGRMASPHWYCRTGDLFEIERPA
ncbi:flavin reductase (DIM6/NTAB) family NADH-FMN oxidoreductase RutF [Haloferula luteola]|uniref:Flavin reductase (DIM6/NTAB) family NADH-FMN oxidoreductase RutF n=1 Tax=Haloferula luteola TaxID=595692 RepID=A0A840VF41_9BACT|nr:flavin reductase family protein [Haloferula luteola]MBB5351431.1 flavin reductase (DIM6/NTAB) family NADH-FMN oxidoreductase RutF [Haloferula luteola]